jgi:hypothetical protein
MKSVTVIADSQMARKVDGLILVARNFTTALALACFNLVAADITVLCSSIIVEFLL